MKDRHRRQTEKMKIARNILLGDNLGLGVVVLLCLMMLKPAKARLITASEEAAGLSKERVLNRHSRSLTWYRPDESLWPQFERCSSMCQPACGKLPYAHTSVPRKCLVCLHKCIDICRIPYDWIQAPLIITSSANAPGTADGDEAEIIYCLMKQSSRTDQAFPPN